MYLKASISLPLLMLLSACASSGDERAAPSAATSVATSAVVAPAATPVSAEVPAQAQQQFDKALASLKAGQTAPATQQLQQLATAYPTFIGPVVNLGLIELKAGRYEAAATLFQQAVQRDTQSAVANNYLGVSYRYLGRFKEAEAAYQAANSADHTYAAAHLNLGVLYDLYLQKPELALPEYQAYQALLSEPDAKVASWIKELSSRLNADKKAKSAASGAQP